MTDPDFYGVLGPSLHERQRRAYLEERQRRRGGGAGRRSRHQGQRVIDSGAYGPRRVIIRTSVWSGDFYSRPPGFHREELTRLIDDSPGLGGMVLGYLAELKLEGILRAGERVSDVFKYDGHDRTGSGDPVATYCGRQFILEVKSFSLSAGVGDSFMRTMPVFQLSVAAGIAHTNGNIFCGPLWRFPGRLFTPLLLMSSGWEFSLPEVSGIPGSRNGSSWRGPVSSSCSLRACWAGPR